MTHFNQLFINDDWNEAVYGQYLIKVLNES